MARPSRGQLSKSLSSQVRIQKLEIVGWNMSHLQIWARRSHGCNIFVQR